MTQGDDVLDFVIRGKDEFSPAAKKASESALTAARDIDRANAQVSRSADDTVHHMTGMGQSALTAGGALSRVGESARSSSSHFTAFGRAVSGLQRPFELAGGSAQKLGGLLANLAGLATKAGLGLAAALGAGALGGIKAAAQYQDAIQHSIAFAGLSQKAAKALNDQIMRLGPALGISAKQMAEGFYNIASAGVQGKDAMLAMTVASKAAAASHTELGQVTDALTTVINAYGLRGKQVAAAQDDLTKATLIGKMEFRDLAASIGQVIPIAANLHVNTKVLGGSMALLTNQGNSAAESTVLLRNIMQSLAAPLPQQQKTLSALGLTVDDVSIKHHGFATVLQTLSEHLHATIPSIKELAAQYNITDKQAEKMQQGLIARTVNTDVTLRNAFGGNQVASRAFLSLWQNNGATLHGYLDQMAASAGSTQTALEKASQSTVFQWNRAKATLEAVGITFGSVLLPAVNQGLTAFSSLGAWFVDHRADVQHFFDTFGQAVAPAVDAAKQAVGAFASWLPGALSSAWSAIGPAAQKVGSDIGAAFSQIGPKIGPALAGIKTALAPAFDGIVSAAQVAFDKLPGILSGVGAKLGPIAADIGKKVSTAFDTITAPKSLDAMAGALRSVQKSAEDLGKGFSSTFQGSKDLDGLLKSLSKSGDQIGDSLHRAGVQLGLFGDSAGGKGSNNLRDFGALLGKIANVTLVGLGEAIQTVSKFLSIGISLIGGIGKTLMDTFTDVKKVFGDMGQLADDLIHGHWSKIAPDAKAIFMDVVHWAEDTGRDLLRTFVNVGEDIVGPKAMGRIIDWAKSAPGRFMGAISALWTELPAKAKDAAGNMMSGMAGKIKDGAGALKTALGNAVTGALNAALDYVKSHNPFDWLKSHMPTLSLPFGNGGGPVSGPALAGGGGYASGSQYGPFGGFSANYVSTGDDAMLSSLGVPHTNPLMDTDFPAAAGTPFRLPPGGAYQMVTQGVDPNTGGYEVWRNIKTGGTLMFLHAQSLSGASSGQVVPGGAYVGTSGHPLTTAFGNDPGFYHLCVVSDTGQVAWLSGAQMAAMAGQGARGGGGAVRPGSGPSAGGGERLPAIFNPAALPVGARYARFLPRQGGDAGGVDWRSAPMDYTGDPSRNPALAGHMSGYGYAATARGITAGQAATGDTTAFHRSMAVLTGAIDKLPPFMQHYMDPALKGFQTDFRKTSADFAAKWHSENETFQTAIGKENNRHAQNLAGINKTSDEAVRAHEAAYQAAQDKANKAHVEALRKENQRYSDAQKAENQHYRDQTHDENARYAAAQKANDADRDSKLKAENARNQAALKANNGQHSKSIDDAHKAHVKAITAAHAAHSTAIDKSHKEHAGKIEKAHSEHAGKIDRSHKEHAGKIEKSHSEHVTNLNKSFADDNAARKRANDDWLKHHQAQLDGQITKEQQRDNAALAGLRSAHQQHQQALIAGYHQHIQALDTSIRNLAKDANLWDGLTGAIGKAIDDGGKRLALHILEGARDVGTIAGQIAREVIDQDRTVGAMARGTAMVDRRTGDLGDFISQLDTLKGLDIKALTRDYQQHHVINQRVLADIVRLTREQQNATLIQNRLSAAMARTIGDVAGFGSALAGTIDIVRQRFTAQFMRGQTPGVVPQGIVRGTDTLRGMDVAGARSDILLARATGDLAGFQAGLQALDAAIRTQLISDILRSSQGLRNHAAQLAHVAEEERLTAIGAAAMNLRIDSITRSFDGFMSDLDAAGSAIRSEILAGAMAGGGVNQTYLDGLVAVTDAQEAGANAQNGLNLMVAAARSDIAGMAAGLQTATQTLTDRWTRAVMDGYGAMNQLTPGLVRAAQAARDLATGEARRDVILGQVTHSFEQMSSGLSTLFQQAQTGLSFFGAMIGRGGDVGENIVDLAKNALGAATNLGTFTDMLSGFGTVISQLEDVAARQVAFGGGISPQTFQAYATATDDQRKAMWDQIQTQLQLTHSTQNLAGYQTTLGNEVQLQTQRVEQLGLTQGQTSAAYLQQLQVLKDMQKEQEGLGLAMQLLTGDTTLTADQIAEANWAIGLFTSGMDPAMAALGGMTGGFTATAASTDDMRSAFDQAKDAASSLGAAALADAGLLGTFGAAVSSATTSLQQLIASAGASALSATAPGMGAPFGITGGMGGGSNPGGRGGAQPESADIVHAGGSASSGGGPVTVGGVTYQPFAGGSAGGGMPAPTYSFSTGGGGGGGGISLPSASSGGETSSPYSYTATHGILTPAQATPVAIVSVSADAAKSMGTGISAASSSTPVAVTTPALRAINPQTGLPGGPFYTGDATAGLPVGMRPMSQADKDAFWANAKAAAGTATGMDKFAAAQLFPTLAAEVAATANNGYGGININGFGLSTYNGEIMVPGYMNNPSLLTGMGTGMQGIGSMGTGSPITGQDLAAYLLNWQHGVQQYMAAYGLGVQGANGSLTSPIDFSQNPYYNALAGAGALPNAGNAGYDPNTGLFANPQTPAQMNWNTRMATVGPNQNASGFQVNRALGPGVWNAGNGYIGYTDAPALGSPANMYASGMFNGMTGWYGGPNAFGPVDPNAPAELGQANPLLGLKFGYGGGGTPMYDTTTQQVLSTLQAIDKNTAATAGNTADLSSRDDMRQWLRDLNQAFQNDRSRHIVGSGDFRDLFDSLGFAELAN